jgi:hypothetical protein
MRRRKQSRRDEGFAVTETTQVIPAATRPTNARLIAFALALLLGVLFASACDGIVNPIRAGLPAPDYVYGDKCWH